MGTERNLRRSLSAAAGSALPFLFLALMSSCDASGPAGPRGPGALHVELESPHGLEGSAVFEVRGGLGLGLVSTEAGEVFYDHGGTSARVVVVLDNPGQIRFQIRAENVKEIPDVRVIQVADGENALRASLEGYQVGVLQVKDGRSP